MAVAASAIAAASGLAYLDAKFHLRKDMKEMRATRIIKSTLEQAVKNDRVSPFYFYEASANRRPDAEAIWTRDGSYTWAQTLNSTYQFAQFFLRQGVKPGDFVALCMQNSVDFIYAWLGLWAVGAAPAMINHNLTGEALVGCIGISTAKMVLLDGTPDILDRVEGIRGDLEARGIAVVQLEPARAEIYALPPARPDDSLRKGFMPGDAMGLFYTSGTTGLPKACKLPMAAAYSLALSNDLGIHPTRDDNERCYCCMPFYHGTGGITMMSQIMAGSTICIARKFSVSSFWSDIRASRSTWFLYVGETLRYLLSTPPSPLDRVHAVHSVYGNGCRPDVWNRFQERFGIDTLAEFYNSTEGPLALRNLARGDFQAHAVGHHGLLQRRKYHDMYVPVEVDHETGEIIRDKDSGLVVRASYEGGGEILVAMPGERPFPGYFGDEKATEKKFVRDVLKKGDQFYRTGDAMRRDEAGRWFFMDRLGDTFRWKGENVSTAEVAEILGKYPGVEEAIVYGVELPGHDGKAGAAALHIDPAQRSSFDYAGLLKLARSKLPKYAVPIFLRVLTQGTASHNNKQNKAPLKKAGVDPDQLNGDEMLWIEGGGKGSTYVPFGRADWDKLHAGKAKL